MSVENQIIIIYAATKKYLLDIEVSRIQEFEKSLFDYIDTKYPEIPASIREKKVIDEECEAALQNAIKECKEQFR